MVHLVVTPRQPTSYRRNLVLACLRVGVLRPSNSQGRIQMGADLGQFALMDTCCHLAWSSTLLGWGKDWFSHYWDNVTEWGYQAMVLAAWSSSEAAP